MIKKIIPLAIITMLPATVFADDAINKADVSGFVDVTYSNDNDTSVFLANAEVDISNKMSKQVSVRIDTDFAIATNGGTNAGLSGPNDSAVLEQAYFAYSPIEGATVIGGVFNNPIGWEKEDAPDMYQINKGQIYKILDNQTALYGNNVAGVALAGGFGSTSVTVAALNDIGLNDVSKNSFAVIVNAAPMKGLDLELGYVTQEKAVGLSAENVWDVNATYIGMGATVGVEVLGAGDIIDTAIGTTLNYAINPMFNLTVRYDTVSYQGVLAAKDDTTSYALAGTFNAAKNLAILAEYTNQDGTLTTTAEDEIFTLEFIASF